MIIFYRVLDQGVWDLWSDFVIVTWADDVW